MELIASTATDAPLHFTLITRNHEPRVSSVQLAEYLGLEHGSVTRLIDTYEDELKQFGVLRFEIEKRQQGQTGRTKCAALLNEDQAQLLLTLGRNTPRTVALKVALIKAFRATRTALDAYREATLPSTHALQDAIKNVPGGPTPWLYSNIAKLVNKTVGIGPDSRLVSNAQKQAALSLLQGVVTHAVLQAADATDAYRRAKVVLTPFVGLPQVKFAA